MWLRGNVVHRGGGKRDVTFITHSGIPKRTETERTSVASIDSPPDAENA
jgi:hypothetical protein